MENGKQEHGEWKRNTEDGKRKTENGKREHGEWKQKTGDRKQERGHGGWKTENGKRDQNFSFLILIKLYNIEEILRVLFIS
jgi:hypothetical protein